MNKEQLKTPTQDNHISSNEVTQKKGKKPIPRTARAITLLLGSLLLIGGCIATYLYSKPVEQEQSKTVTAYKISADAKYRVLLQPNTLYKEEALGEDQIYSEKLTDSIEINYQGDVSVTNEANLSGGYSITAVLEGFQERANVRKKIYERRYPVHSEEFKERAAQNIPFEKTIRIRPADHKKFAENAENILGGSTSRELYILMEGKFTIAGEEKSFTHKISMPVSSENFYDITKPEAVLEEGEITESSQAIIRPSLQNYLPSLVTAIIGALLILGILLLTRIPTSEEEWTLTLKKLMRKYGSRMIRVAAVPQQENAKIVELDDMDSMVALAEELRTPIMYEASETLDGSFYILGKEYLYVLRLAKPTTPLEVV